MAELTDEELEFLHSVLDLAREGRTEELAGYLDAGVPVNLTGSNGDTLLILAAYHVHPETVDMLLGRSADPDRVNQRGQTALAAAVFRQSAEIVSALLAAGGDPHAGSPTAVEFSRQFELPEMEQLLLRED